MLELSDLLCLSVNLKIQMSGCVVHLGSNCSYVDAIKNKGQEGAAILSPRITDLLISSIALVVAVVCLAFFTTATP